MSPIGFLPKVFQTKSIALNSGNIQSATLTINDSQLSDPTAFGFYLTNDGGASWATVQRGVRHTFTSSGDDLRLMIIGNSGSVIDLETTREDSSPITIKYNYA